MPEKKAAVARPAVKTNGRHNGHSTDILELSTPVNEGRKGHNMPEDKLTTMKIENIRGDVSDAKKDLEALRREHDTKVKDLEDEMKRVRDQNTLYRAELDQLRRDIESLKHSEIGKELSNVKVDIAKLTERLTVMQVIQTTYSTVAGIVAALVGKS